MTTRPEETTMDPETETTTTEPVVAAPPEAVQPGPWAADLPTYFGEDAEVQAKVDHYLREKWQPHVTKLETESAPARELWSDLEADAGQTIADLVASVHGDEFAEEYVKLFAEDEPAPPDPAPGDPPARSTDDQELLDWAREQRDKDMRSSRATAYEQAKSEFQAAHPADLSQADLKFFDPFIAAAEGDFDKALEAFKTYGQEFAAARGVAPEPTAVVPTPPPVLGSEAAPAATPPVAPQYTKYSQLGDALDDVLGELRATSTPPPILG